jgi:hypothetical protein
MTFHTHVSAPTEFVEVDGTRIAFRAFGKEEAYQSSCSTTTEPAWTTGTQSSRTDWLRGGK